MRRNRGVLAALFVIFVVLGGCGGDSTTPGGQVYWDVQVEIEVVDINGDPVGDLNMSMMSDNPYMRDPAKGLTRGSANALTKIVYTIPDSGQVEIKIFDIEGKQMRLLLNEWAPAGSYSQMWDGKDDLGIHQTSGRYTVQLTLQDYSGSLIGENSFDILMALERSNPVGVTDASGRITLTDRRLFPHLYHGEPMVATDYTSNPIGLIELDETMYFYFYTEDRSLVQDVRRDVFGSGEITIVWDPVSTVLLKRSTECPEFSPSPSAPEGVQLSAYPNPFN